MTEYYEYEAPIGKCLNTRILNATDTGEFESLLYDLYRKEKIIIKSENCECKLNNINFSVDCSKIDEVSAWPYFSVTVINTPSKAELVKTIKDFLVTVLTGLNEQLANNKITKHLPKNEDILIYDDNIFIKIQNQKQKEIEYGTLCFDLNIDDDQVNQIIEDLEDSAGVKYG